VTARERAARAVTSALVGAFLPLGLARGPVRFDASLTSSVCYRIRGLARAAGSFRCAAVA